MSDKCLIFHDLTILVFLTCKTNLIYFVAVKDATMTITGLLSYTQCYIGARFIYEHGRKLANTKIYVLQIFFFISYCCIVS